MTEEYGPVFSLRQGTRIFIIIGRHRAAMEIMEKQGASLADRPRSIAAGETLSGGMRIVVERTGDRLRRLRRYDSPISNLVGIRHLRTICSCDTELCMRCCNPRLRRLTSRYRSDMQRACCSTSWKTLGTTRCTLNGTLPRAVRCWVRLRPVDLRYAASVTMSITYGKTTPTAYSDPEVLAVNRCLSRLGRVMRPGAYLVDTYPILKYVPGYLTQLRKWHHEELALFQGQLNLVREQMVW